MEHTLITGTMGCGKSAHLISEVHRLKSQGINVVVLTADEVDENRIVSRNGKSVHATKATDYAVAILHAAARYGYLPEPTVVLVDEYQWLSQSSLEALLASRLTVQFYGLEARDYQTPASLALHRYRHVKQVRLRGSCGFCGKEAIRNIKTDLPSPLAKNGYAPVCTIHNLLISQENN